MSRNRRRSLLTKRQREVMRWVAMGKTNSEIADILGVSAGTVKNHVAHIVRVYGVNSTNSRLSAVVHALARGDITMKEICSEKLGHIGTRWHKGSLLEEPQ